MEHLDVIVIGSGQAGGPLSWRLAGAGRRVALVERADLGGTCTNTGCTPTKTFIASAEAAHRARVAGALGVDVGPVRVDLARVVERKDAMVERWRSGVARNVEEAGEGLTLVRGHARFVDARTVAVGDRRLVADTVVLNTGARPAVPPIPGLDGVPWLDNRRAMELTSLPEHLVVLGGGFIGCELGQAYRRFGSRVTIVQGAPHLLPMEDDDVSEALEAAFAEEGIEVVTGLRAVAVRAAGDGVRVDLPDGRRVQGSHLLVATGRVPNTDDLGCEAAGVAVDDHGYVRIDERFRTTAEGVYAVGDCTGGPQFTHASWDDHRILFDLLEGRATRTGAGRLVPYAAFTDPQVARIGLSERDARDRGVPHEVATLPFGHVARAIETGRTAGLVKVLVDPATDRVLGAAVVGAEAAELVTVFEALMVAGAPVGALVDAQMIHPAYVEGLQSAVMRLGRFALS